MNKKWDERLTYRYAPLQFSAYWRDQKGKLQLITLSDEEQIKCETTLISKGDDICRATLKRILRSKERKRVVIYTIGFRSYDGYCIYLKDTHFAQYDQESAFYIYKKVIDELNGLVWKIEKYDGCDGFHFLCEFDHGRLSLFRLT